MANSKKWFSFPILFAGFLTLLIATFSLGASGVAQEMCNRFDGTASANSSLWVPCANAPNITASVINSNSIGGSTDNYLHVADESGGSQVCTSNTNPLLGDWTKQGPCAQLCLDVQSFDNFNTLGRIFWAVLKSGTKSFGFAFSNPADHLVVDGNWRNFCLPTNIVTTGAPPPSNSQGSWVPTPSTGTVPGDWNALLTNITEVRLPADGTSSPSERIGYDNICVSNSGNCPSSAAKIKVFTKTAKLLCDKIEYSIHLETVSDGAAQQIIKVSDVWPSGTFAANSIQVIGSTGIPPLGANFGAAGWSYDLKTAAGTGSVVSTYDITFTVPIDQTAAVSGAIKISNQASVKIGTGATILSGSAIGNLLPTVVTTTVADIKKCNPPNEPPKSSSCLSADPKVTCGKTPGSYVVTLSPNSTGSTSPSEFEVTVLTPGVSIQNAQPKYIIGPSGQLQLTLIGANLGDVIEFDISGSQTDPKSKDGMSLCCVDKIKITIPKDLKCDQIDIDVAIKKTVKKNEDQSYNFRIEVSNEASSFTPASGGLTFTDVVPPGMTFNSVTPMSNWSCSPVLPPAMVAGSTLTCTYIGTSTGSTLLAGPAQFIGAVVINATLTGSEPVKNCAVVLLAASGSPTAETTLANNTSCIEVNDDKKKHDVAIVKKATVNNQAIVTYGFTLDVTNKGDALAAGGTVTVTDVVPAGLKFTSVVASAGWACSPATPLAAGATLTCNYTGGAVPANTAMGSIVIQAQPVSPQNLGPFENCANTNFTTVSTLTDVNMADNKSCVTVNSETGEPPIYDVKIEKSGKLVSTAGSPSAYEYDLLVTNLDAVITPAANVVVTDVVPAGLTFTSAQGTNWTCASLPATAGQTVTCTYSGTGTLAQNATLPPIKINATGNQEQAFENCANIALTPASGLTDFDTTNNRSCKILIPGIIPPVDPPDYSAACGTNVIFVVDVSGSIQAAGQTGIVQAALNNAKNQFNSTNASGVQAQAAVIAFSDSATVVNPLSSSTFTSASSLTFGGETNWEAGLKAARLMAASSPAPTIIVFITDGIPNKYLNATGGVVSTSDSALATNEAIGEVNQIYAMSPPVPIVGIGVGNVNNYLDALLGTASVQSSFSGIYGELDQLGKKMCPDIRLSKSMSPWIINYFNSPGPHTVNITLSVASTTGALTNVKVRDILPPELTNPVSSDPNVAISGSTIDWTLPNLAANGSASTSITVTVNPPAGLTCNYTQVKNWAQVIGTDQPVHSIPNNMASTGPAEHDEAASAINLRNCEPIIVQQNPILYVRKTSMESCYPQGQEAIVAGKPTCEFTVQISAFNGDFTGTVDFGDSVFNTSGMVSTPSALAAVTVTTDDTALAPSVGSLCVNGFTALPASCTQAGFTLHQNKSITVKYKLAAPPPLAPGNYKNCFKATASTMTAAQSAWSVFNTTTPNAQNGQYWGYCGSFSVPASTNKIAPPNCDTKTAKLSGDSCRCIIRGMVPVSKTSCACPDGQKLTNGACTTPPPPPPKCDGKTAKLSGNRCVCTVRGSVPVSKTSCDCPKGQDVRNGKCSVPPPPPPRCDGETAKLKGDRCVCTVRGMVPVSKTSCACPKGQKIVNGRCSVPPPPPPKCDGRTAKAQGNRCVCIARGMVPVSKSSCGCPDGTKFNGKRCVEPVQQCERGQIRVGKRCIDVPRCPRGQVPVPGTPLCVKIGGDGHDQEKDVEDIPRKRGGIEIPGL